MATSVTTETGDLCELPPDPGKSPGPWKWSKEDGNPPLSFRDVLMQVQHKGSCYLEISEPESEGFESDEWEEDEQQIHNQGPSNCLLVININGETKRRIYQPWRKSLIVKVLGKKVVKRLHPHQLLLTMLLVLCLLTQRAQEEPLKKRNFYSK